MKETIRYADFWTRLLAHNIDLIPIIGLFYLGTMLIASPDYDYLIVSSIYFGYYIAFEASKFQATPGKLLTKIKVQRPMHSKASIFRISVRNLAKILSLIICFGGFILIFFDRNHRALHDYIGGTVVLFDED